MDIAKKIEQILIKRINKGMDEDLVDTHIYTTKSWLACEWQLGNVKEDLFDFFNNYIEEYAYKIQRNNL